MFDEYIVALVKNYAQPQFLEITQTVNTLSEELQILIEDYHARGQKVAIWGAGGKGLSVLAAAGISKIDLLVDGDLNKQGLFTPVSHLKVEAPSAILSEGISAVIITAMAYKEEIMRSLSDDLCFDGDIFVLGHHLHPVDNRKDLAK